jgi:lysyl-tRNA synthetase class 2
MKRLLCAGWPDIYQICKVYRDGEVGPRHQPEFTMIEWYRRDLSLQAMISHTTEFIRELLGQPDRSYPVVTMSYRDAFRHYLQLDPLSASITELGQAAAADAQLADAIGTQRDQWLDLLLSTKLAPQFDPETLLVLHHYPASQAALARLCPEDPRVADRFEIFCGELELANGYYELGDPDEQLRRCQQDQQQRQSQAAPQRPLDENFLAALRAGLPPCCGVAIGFDRLVMLRLQTSRLDDVQIFTTVDANHG